MRVHTYTFVVDDESDIKLTYQGGRLAVDFNGNMVLETKSPNVSGIVDWAQAVEVIFPTIRDNALRVAKLVVEKNGGKIPDA